MEKYFLFQDLGQSFYIADLDMRSSPSDGQFHSLKLFYKLLIHISSSLKKKKSLSPLPIPNSGLGELNELLKFTQFLA